MCYNNSGVLYPSFDNKEDEDIDNKSESNENKIISTISNVANKLYSNKNKIQSNSIENNNNNNNNRNINRNNNNTNTNKKTYYRFKYILLGEVSVGKTCIAEKFVNNLFSEKYLCTVGVEFKLKTLNLSSNVSVDLQIWDTCGQEKFRSITKQYYKDAQGILLVFDLTSKKSFLELEYWIEEINSVIKLNSIYANTNNTYCNTSIILIGNKRDLIKEREISYLEASNFAKKHNIEYIEVSAKESTNINECFENITWTVVHNEEQKSVVSNNEENEKNEEDKNNNNNSNSKESKFKKGAIKIKDYLIKNKSFIKKKNCC